MAETLGIPDGAAVTYEGKTYVMDDNELVEIVCSFDDRGATLKSLRAEHGA